MAIYLTPSQITQINNQTGWNLDVNNPNPDLSRTQFNLKLSNGTVIPAGINPGQAATIDLGTYSGPELFKAGQDYLQSIGATQTTRDKVPELPPTGPTNVWVKPDGSVLEVGKDFYEKLGKTFLEGQGKEVTTGGTLDRSTAEGAAIASTQPYQTVTPDLSAVNPNQNVFAQTPEDLAGAQQAHVTAAADQVAALAQQVAAQQPTPATPTTTPVTTPTSVTPTPVTPVTTPTQTPTPSLSQGVTGTDVFGNFVPSGNLTPAPQTITPFSPTGQPSGTPISVTPSPTTTSQTTTPSIIQPTTTPTVTPTAPVTPTTPAQEPFVFSPTGQPTGMPVDLTPGDIGGNQTTTPAFTQPTTTQPQSASASIAEANVLAGTAPTVEQTQREQLDNAMKTLTEMQNQINVPAPEPVAPTPVPTDNTPVDVSANLATSADTNTNTKLQNLMQELTGGGPLGESKSITDVVKELSASMGLPDITAEIQSIDDQYADDVMEVNSNPWMSEGQRAKEVQLLQAKYETKKNSLIDRLSLQDSLIGKAISYYQSEREYKKDLMFKSLDMAESQMKQKMDAEEKAQIFARETSPLRIETVSGITYLRDGTGRIVDTIEPPKPGESTKEYEAKMAKLLQGKSAITAMEDKIDTVDSIINHSGMDSRVGTTPIDRGLFGISDYLSGAGSDFAASIHQLTGGLTLQSLINAKANGATFGALSNAELELLANSATKITDWEKKKDGIGTGYWKIDEQSFVKELNVIQELTQKAIDLEAQRLMDTDELLTIDSMFPSSSGQPVVNGTTFFNK